MKYGKCATFMPKPVYGEAGSGMHVHMLLLKDGKPVFYDENACVIGGGIISDVIFNAEKNAGVTA